MKINNRISIGAMLLILIVLPLLYYNIPDCPTSYDLWHLGNALELWIAFLLIRYLLTFISEIHGIWYSYSVILTTLSLINLLDELFGHPEKHEPSEYIMGTGVIVYEIIQYFRRKKLNSNA